MNFLKGGGLQFAMQVLGMTVIVGWCTVNALILFIILKYTGIFRASTEEEGHGMDTIKHGGYGYLFDYNPLASQVRAAVGAEAHSSNGSAAVVAVKESNSQPSQAAVHSENGAAKNSDNISVEMDAVVGQNNESSSSSSPSSSDGSPSNNSDDDSSHS
jgi:hypothetical protein